MGKTLGYGEITVANMTEPFTVMLTNEAQQFATDSNRKVTSAQSYYTDIIVIRGSQERTDYTIGNITSGSGITVSKSSKRVTFSVSAGTTIGADTGVIEIPITLDGQTVKKQFSWSCGKQGPQGVKGENGSKGKSVQNVIEYYLATSASSNVTSSTNGWSTDPTTQKLTSEKKYLWNCKQTVYDDGTKGSITAPVICGTYGETGKNALQSNRTYTGTYTTVGEIAYTSTSSFNRTPIVGDIYTCLDGSSNTGTWQVTAISGTNVTVKLLGYIKSKGEDGKNGADGNSFAWNMLSETNCGKKHWGTESSGGKYSVEDFITEDNINAVKLICTEAISTSNWSYVSFKDIKMLKQLKPSTKYTLSYDIKANRSGAISHSICKGDVSNFCTNTVVVNNIIGNETWQHISVVLTTNDLKTTPTNEILYLGRNALSKVGYSIIKNLKLVEGDIDTPWSPSQSDIEGKGVVETVQYYLATSQASGVTSSTSGWSTDITTQKLTADKKYLWNCYQTKYSDGTSEPISTPKVIGVYGDKGTSTKIIRTSYEYTQTNIDKFSTSGYSGVWGVNDATTGLKVGDSVLLKVKNTTKGSDCLIFANITAIPSNYSLTCTSYGVIDNGSDGQDGAGFHWNLLKYSGDLSKQVLGGAGTYTATVESIEDKTTPSGQAEKITYTVQGTGGKFIQTGKYIKEGNIKQGKTYTVSVWCKCSSIKSTGVINAEFLDNKTYVNPTLSTEWQQYVVTGVANKDVTSTSSASAISFYYNDNMSVGDIFYISSPKVEEGDKASPWCTTYEETLAKNLTITPSSQYFKSTDGGKTFAPNTITIKPTIQGEISFGKWQYSIDGGVSFADVVSGQKGLTVSNNVLTVSKDSSLYSDAVTMITFRAVADDSSFYDTCSIAKIYDVSDIGDGRNLLWNSNFAKTDEAITGTTNSWGLHTRGTNLVASIDTSTKHNGFNTLKTVSAANGDKNSSNDLEWFAWGISERTSDNLHSKNQNYTLSFYAKASVTTDFIVRWGYDAYGADTTRTLTTNWQKYEIKLHQATSAYSITIIFKLLTAGTVWFSEFKLEKGSSATGYSTAPEDLQTAILSTKSEISDVSLKVDKNKQAIEQRVEKTTYQQDLNLVKGDISKANEGLNKWRYEIYPKSLFDSTDQGKSTIDIFAKNKNLTPSRTVLFNDTDLSIQWNSAENYIGYALTFTKFSAAKSVAITFAHDDGAHIYLNGKLIGGSDVYSQTGESLTLGFVKGWNCIEVVVNDKNSYEGFTLGTTISTISECQLMNCYYGTPVARQSHITNQLVENTTNIKGISTKVSKVTSVIGDNGENFTSFKNEYSDFKQTMNGFKTTVSQTYVTKDDFNGLEIGGRNLLLYSQTIRAHNDYYNVGWLTDEVETFNGCPVWSVKNQWGKLAWLFKSHVIDRGLVKVGDTLTYSLYAKTNNASGKSINCSYRFKGDANAYWFNGSGFNVGTSWARYSVTFTVTKDMLAADTYMTEIGFEETASMSGDDKVYYACPKLERGTKATDYTPAPEDNEINGQNLVSNLPSNWEQGSINYTANLAYGSLKSTLVSRLRTKDVFPVSGNITISAGTSTNSSKEELNFYYVLFDINKKSISHGDTWQSLTSPKIINCGNAKYMAIILRWGSGSTAITPSDISQICLKIERGTSATPFTLAPEDVNGKIVNVETIANQTAKKFEWIVKGGDSSSNFTLTDRVADLVAERINFKGLVTFSGLNTDAKNEIGKVAQSKVDGLEVGGRNLLVQKNITEGYLSTDGKGSFVGSGGGDQTSDWIDVSGNKYITITLYEDFTNTNNSGRYCEYDADKNCINTVVYNPRQKSSIIIELKSNTKYIRVTAIECKTRRYKIEAGNKATDWTPAPEDVSQDATNKASQALTDAKNYSSNAVNWVTNNGSSTTSLNSMVKKWTDGAVSDTTQINGGWIKANTITASKIALADFTNYSQLTRDTAATYGFAVTDDTDGTWFSTQGIRRDQFISETFPCNGGESYLIEYDISTNAKGANNSTDTKNYIGVAIGVYGYTGTVGSNGLPNKATNIWYATRVTGSEAAAVTHVKTTITTSTATKQFRIFLQSNGYYFEGTTKIRNLSVRRIYGGTLIVDGSITANKIATDAIKSRNYISSGGTQGSFLNLNDGSFTSPNLSWDSNGNLIAKNANLSGQINATKGTVGGWNIATNGLYSGIDENAIKIYSATTYDAQTMYQKQKIQDSFILSQKYINHFVSQQVSVGHNIPYWQTRSFIYNDSQIQLAQSDYCINTSSASNYDAQYSLKDGYISATRIYMEQNITQVGGDVINSSFSIGLDSMMGWCSIQSTKGINIYGNSSRALYVQSNDTSKYNALETEGDVVVNGKIHAVSGDNKIQLNSDNNGSIELYGNTPFIDFHSAYSSADYTCRIIANTPEQLLVCGKLRCDSNIISNNDLIANSWVYAGQNAHYTWQNQLDCYFSCGYYNNTNNVYYYAGYHAFYVNNDSGSGMMYINTNGVTSRVGFTKTSDERIKKNFESFDDNIIDAYMNIEPVKYQLKQSSNDNYHFGFKAQHVDKVFSDYGDTYNESFDICTSRPIDPDKAKELYGVDDMTEEYGLRYDELIAPTTYMVQHIYKELESTKGELAKVKQEKADLETRLQAIEAKLRL
jgi:hypothetical protein